LDEKLEDAIEANAQERFSDNFREGVKAFLERRRADWPNMKPKAYPRIQSQRLQAQFAMKTQPDQFQALRVRQPEDQHQTGLDMAVAMVAPLPGERMIAKFSGKGLSAANREMLRSNPHPGSPDAGLSLRACNPS
jgi:hypothetical protein